MAEKLNLCKSVWQEANTTLIPHINQLKLLMEEREKLLSEKESITVSLQDDLNLLENDYQEALSKLDEEERIELSKLKKSPADLDINHNQKILFRSQPAINLPITDILKVVKRHGKTRLKKQIKEKAETYHILKDFWMIKASAIECLINVVKISKEFDEKEIKEAKDLQARYMATQISFALK